MPLLPNVPTAVEVGFEEVEHVAWNRLLAPAGTPKDIVTRLNSGVRELLRKPDIRDHYEHTGGEAVGSSPVQCRELIASELPRMQRIIKLTGVKFAVTCRPAIGTVPSAGTLPPW